MTAGTTLRTRLWKRTLLVPAAGCLLVLWLTAPAPAAQVGLAVSPAVGPPTTVAKAKGSGFAAREAVAVLLDGLEVGSGATGPTGRFNLRFTVPAAARPGEHAVEAVGRSSGRSARASFLVRTDWLQACFDSRRTCFNRYENVVGPREAPALTVRWRAHVGTDGSSAPVYANGRLFVGTAGGLVGLDPATGAIIINYRSGPVTAPPAVVRAFDPQPDPPCKVIFGTADGILHAVSTSGEPLWQVGLGAAPAFPLVIEGIGDPTIRIVVGAGDRLFALDGNGKQLWDTVLEGGDISKGAAVLTAPPEPEQVVVAAGRTLHALDAATGRVVWSTTPSHSPLGAPSIGHPSILVGDAAGTLFSLDPATGAVTASFAARGPIAGTAAIGDPNQVGDPNLFVGDGGGDIYAFDSTDDLPAPEWSAALGGPFDGPPVLANGVLYVATDPGIGDPHLFALDAASGRTLLDSVLPGGVAASPIVADGRLIAATRSGDVLAYEGPDS